MFTYQGSTMVNPMYCTQKSQYCSNSSTQRRIFIPAYVQELAFSTHLKESWNNVPVHCYPERNTCTKVIITFNDTFQSVQKQLKNRFLLQLTSQTNFKENAVQLCLGWDFQVSEVGTVFCVPFCRQESQQKTRNETEACELSLLPLHHHQQKKMTG